MEPEIITYLILTSLGAKRLTSESNRSPNPLNKVDPPIIEFLKIKTWKYLAADIDFQTDYDRKTVIRGMYPVIGIQSYYIFQ